MSEDEAYEVAVRHLREIGATSYRCFSRGFESDCEMVPGPLGESNLPAGRRRKIWTFAFTFKEYPPEVVVSGNGGVVSVDDETGICSYFASL